MFDNENCNLQFIVTIYAMLYIYILMFMFIYTIKAILQQRVYSEIYSREIYEYIK